MTFCNGVTGVTGKNNNLYREYIARVYIWKFTHTLAKEKKTPVTPVTPVTSQNGTPETLINQRFANPALVTVENTGTGTPVTENRKQCTKQIKRMPIMTCA